jgi:hypothetical protein
VFAPFPADTDSFGRLEQGWMLNLRVRDLDAMLAQLRAAGVAIDSQETEEGADQFAWLADPKATGSSCGSLPQTCWSPLTGVADPRPNSDA